MRPILFRDEIKVKKVLLYHLYIALLTLLPFFTAILAGLIGKCLNCNINEAGTDQCVRAGIAFGNVLNPLAVTGWLLVITLPIGVIATVILIIIAVHDTIYHTRR